MIIIHLVVGNEKTVVFVGEKQSGKTSLIAKYLDEPVRDDVKETTALDFRYGVRTKDEKKQKVNIYELGKNSFNDIIFRWRSYYIKLVISTIELIQHCKYCYLYRD